jgi:hypothetical protein
MRWWLFFFAPLPVTVCVDGPEPQAWGGWREGGTDWWLSLLWAARHHCYLTQIPDQIIKFLYYDLGPKLLFVPGPTEEFERGVSKIPDIQQQRKLVGIAICYGRSIKRVELLKKSQETLYPIFKLLLKNLL